MKYVAVVCTDADISARFDGDYACFLGPTKQNVIVRAMRAREKWGVKLYRILVGRITEHAEADMNYVLRPLREKDGRRGSRVRSTPTVAIEAAEAAVGRLRKRHRMGKSTLA